MAFKLDCPNCGTRLGVPTGAIGKRGRCTHCREAFIVPEPRATLDDSVAGWLTDLDDDVDDEADRPSAPGVAAAPMPSSIRKGANDDVASASAPAPDAPPSAKVVHEPVVRRHPSDTKRSRRTRTVTVSEPKRSRSRPAVEGNGRPIASDDDGDSKITSDHSIRLKLQQMSTAGVTLTFDARFLTDPLFRASMPMCCVVGDVINPRELVARPLAWIDKATGHFTNPVELEARYQYPLHDEQTVREVAAAMRTIEELTPPFNEPMPYFVSWHRTSEISIHCETLASPRGVSCAVTIPRPGYALQWLARVNGVCCAEYDQLERYVVRLQGGAWRELSDKVRERLASWFISQDDETFLAYVPDSDFQTKDDGLAGVVLTSQRLVWTKYQKHGSVPLDAEVMLRLEKDGAFYDLLFQIGQRRKPMVRLRAAHAHRLISALDELACPLRVTRARKSP